MFDVNGTEFFTGAVVVCYEPIEGYTTYSKVYNVTGLRTEEDRIVITDDNGREGWFKASRFEVVVPKTRHDTAKEESCLAETKKLWRN